MLHLDMFWIQLRSFCTKVILFYFSNFIDGFEILLPPNMLILPSGPEALGTLGKNIPKYFFGNPKHVQSYFLVINKLFSWLNCFIQIVYLVFLLDPWKQNDVAEFSHHLWTQPAA